MLGQTASRHVPRIYVADTGHGYSFKSTTLPSVINEDNSFPDISAHGAEISQALSAPAKFSMRTGIKRNLLSCTDEEEGTAFMSCSIRVSPEGCVIQ